jgi:transcriptional regulator with XRE-family HTH domain
MNRILYVARKAKGFTTAQLAKVLEIEENGYYEIEHSLADISAQQALKLSKLFDVDPEIFLYTEGRDSRLVKHAMDEISGYLKKGELEELKPADYIRTVALGNTALSLMVDLNHALYKQYELEKDNRALRRLIALFKEQGK